LNALRKGVVKKTTTKKKNWHRRFQGFKTQTAGSAGLGFGGH
jgi:hypothetical protein